jgi:hypothetical protein
VIHCASGRQNKAHAAKDAAIKVAQENVRAYNEIIEERKGKRGKVSESER